MMELDWDTFNKESEGWDIIAFENLNIDYLKRYCKAHALFFIEPIEPFKQGLLVDATSLNVIVACYNALNSQSKQKFEDVILKQPYKFALFLDKMWSWVR